MTNNVNQIEKILLKIIKILKIDLKKSNIEQNQKQIFY